MMLLVTFVLLIQVLARPIIIPINVNRLVFGTITDIIILLVQQIPIEAVTVIVIVIHHYIITKIPVAIVRYVVQIANVVLIPLGSVLNANLGTTWLIHLPAKVAVQ